MVKDFDYLVVGSTVLYDYIFTVDQLPLPGRVATVDSQSKNNINHGFFGGTAVNVACQLALLNQPVKLVHPVSQDFSGSIYERKLLDLNISLEHLLYTEEKFDGYAILVTAPDGSTLLISSPTPLPHPEISSSIWENTYALVLTPNFGLLHKKLITISESIDIPLVIVGIGSPAIIELLPRCLMVSINHNESINLLHASGDSSFEKFSKRIQGVLFITHGNRGCNVYKHGEYLGKADVIPPEKTVDPTGAGDSFAATALACLKIGYTPIQAAQIGAAAASCVVEAFGSQTNMPGWNQIARRLKYYDPQTSELINQQQKGKANDH